MMVDPDDTPVFFLAIEKVFLQVSITVGSELSPKSEMTTIPISCEGLVADSTNPLIFMRLLRTIIEKYKPCLRISNQPDSSRKYPVEIRLVRKYNRFHSLHHFCRKLKADSVRLRILSSGIRDLKSVVSRGVLFKTTTQGIPGSIGCLNT